MKYDVGERGYTVFLHILTYFPPKKVKFKEIQEGEKNDNYSSKSDSQSNVKVVRGSKSDDNSEDVTNLLAPAT